MGEVQNAVRLRPCRSKLLSDQLFIQTFLSWWACVFVASAE